MLTNPLRTITTLLRYWRLRWHRASRRRFARRLQMMTRIQTTSTGRPRDSRNWSSEYMESLRNR